MNKPNLFVFARTILAYLVVMLAFGLVYLMVFRAIPTGNEQVLNVIIGVLIGSVTTIVSYYFGNSKDKSDADQAQTLKNT